MGEAVTCLLPGQERYSTLRRCEKQQGVFTVTKGLQQEFGPERVMDTPLSEAAIAGAAVGAAMFGRRPVAEIMFNNLLALCGDEIHNQAGKFYYASGGQVKVPAVIRTSSWMRMVSGPHHCGVLDAWMLHTPGIKVVAPSCPADRARRVGTHKLLC